MAEVKNSFLKSRMNQDLDDRLIPNGEYKYANNISVGKSEADDIGTLQNILGNELLPLTNNSPFIPGTTTPNPNYIPGLECIGSFMDNQNNRIFQFLTDYTDPNPNDITLPTSGNMKITMYNFDSPAGYTTLVEGLFLNFAKNNEFRITGVNLVEGLLFWVDNRNQPRKINVSNALGNPLYYTTETQISVAKYAPIDPILLYRKVVAIADGDSVTDTVDVEDAEGIVPGMTLVTDNISSGDFCLVVDVTGTTITFHQNLPSIITSGTELTFLISTMSNKSDEVDWPGDPVFLEDKYVRFSYRFKYDDNEYSLTAPFTQIAYIPKQKGYFVKGNEIDAYRSTVINWFENNINNIELIIPLPDKIGNLSNSYKIKEIDVLYKESDSLAIKVLETLPVSSINSPANTNNNYYIQPYQSQRPYRTLTDDQSVRVYDKVPVRARAQESVGNRIIYGNYYDKYTCVDTVNYNVSIQPKLPRGTNFIEYPNHTLKKNRNYQIGFVIADKFGRQSPVILSSVDLLAANIGGGIYAKGSTIYSSYENSPVFTDVREWFGDTLLLYISSIIDQKKDIPAGKPGLYAIPTSNSGFAITASTITDTSYTYTLDTTATTNTPPVVGDILRGYYTDYVEVIPPPPPPYTPPVAPVYEVFTSGRVNDIYNYNDQGPGTLDIKFSYIYNPIGWYSYKVVVKQPEQDYYNVYLPGMLVGYPQGQTFGSQVTYTGTAFDPTLQNGINTTQFPVSETASTSHIVLINDNINKVPRDLSDVGPDQKQYRSSVQLYGRVENTEAFVDIIGNIPAYSSKTSILKYTVGPGLNVDWALIKAGDGIQCEEASEPVPDNTPPATGLATTQSPYRWLGDLVVVSNSVSGTDGTMIISSPNWVLKAAQNPNGTDYRNFRITRAENRQYFPTRKADMVSSIASATEFNFLSSSANNLAGTAGLNLYQLQSDPLIGRVSTVQQIGVTARDMIPFLSIYETKPEQSALDLFWETTTTGLISDLNADVLTGYDGPSKFSNVGYRHFEEQDPYGSGSVAGDPDSKYITDEFVVVNQFDTILNDTSAVLWAVDDGVTGNTDRLSYFGLEVIPPAGLTLPTKYRLYIKKPEDGGGRFVFNNDASTLESYTFTLRVTSRDTGTPITSDLYINGRLSNNAPIITTSVVDYNIAQSTTNFVTLQANNGSFFNGTTIPISITGLKWSITSGNDDDYFSLDEYTGALSLIDNEIPLGGYTLGIKVQDAVNTSTGAILPPEGNDYGTKFATTTLNINVGDNPVPIWLRPEYTSLNPIVAGSDCSGLEPPYAMVYIGPTQDFSGPLGDYDYLPLIPGSSRQYQFAENIEIINATIQGETIVPTGLISGEYRVSIKLTVPAPALCDPSLNLAAFGKKIDIYLYKREYNATAPGQWELAATTNNKQTPYSSPNLVVTTVSPPVTYGLEKAITTSFTIEALKGIDKFYEWAIGIDMKNVATAATNSAPNPLIFPPIPNTPSVEIYGRDANYSYDGFIPFDNLITTAYTYLTGLEQVSAPGVPGYPSAVPYETPDARKGLQYFSPINTIASGSVLAGSNIANFILTTTNNQIAPGLAVGIDAIPAYSPGRVVGVNQVTREISVQLLGIPGPAYNLAGTNVSFGFNFIYDPLFPTVGTLYANTEEGTEVKRFYTDINLSNKWIPPVPNRFYVFQTTKNYNPGQVIWPNGPNAGVLKYTEFPFYCAEFNEDGEVIEQTVQSGYFDSQTAWIGMANDQNNPLPIDNYAYNILYYEEPF